MIRVIFSAAMTGAAAGIIGHLLHSIAAGLTALVVISAACIVSAVRSSRRAAAA